jgi:hypothetical protein
MSLFMLAVKSKVLSLVIDMFVDANDCLSGEGAVTEEMARLQGRYAALGSMLGVSRNAGTADRIFSNMFRDRVLEPCEGYGASVH